MRRASAAALLLGLAVVAPSEARVVVFQEPAFPVVESEAPSRETLDGALSGLDVAFAGVDALPKPETLAGADLLVLPYGSAFPADDWDSIRAYLEGGGNLLTLGGRPLTVPAFRQSGGGFRLGRPDMGYWRLLAAVDATEVPPTDFSRFAWDGVWGFKTPAIRAHRVFAVTTLFVANFSVPEGTWRGLGYFLDSRGRRIAAPVTRLDFALTPPGREPKGHGRLVMLTFDPEPGYWDTAAGRSLIRETAEHAARGPAQLWAQVPRASLLEGETASVVVHLHDWHAPPRATMPERRVLVELRRDDEVLDTRTIECRSDLETANVLFPAATEPGLYGVRASFERDSGLVEVHETGFWRRDPKLLASGARLTAGPTYLRADGKPFLAIGVNHWVNDTVWPFFPENGNALEWDRDFAEMAARGFTFVRTGIWFDRLRLVDAATGAAKESVLRNIEALLEAAGKHGLQVQFTFFSFEPQTIVHSERNILGPGRNPYTDPVAVESQKTFVRSIADRFRDVPFLSWDLINEPSFSNPHVIFRGNQPNGDPTEVAAWNEWLRKRYQTPLALAEAWASLPQDMVSFGGIPLPAPADLGLTRNGNPKEVRAVDYNLFAQDMFGRWVGEMVGAIRSTGTKQIVGVGQDEGGVSDRLLNQFYGGAGVDITSMHSWWSDDALLWDAVAAKRPGMPNIVGETGPQPAVSVGGRSRWDETGGLALLERKLVLGLAAGNSGALGWIWSRADPFHIGRPDGSSTLWVDALTHLGAFAKDLAPHLSDARPGEVAIVLPQSLQLSALGRFGLEAQQACVRALYQRARSSAYVVGEYQIELLGHPQLILLPSPWVLSHRAWEAILGSVRGGATLLVTGPFDDDEHFRPSRRMKDLGLDDGSADLVTRENPVEWPGGRGRAVFSGDKTTYLEQARLPAGATFARKAVGQGQVLFFTLPLELNDDARLLGDVYRWALDQAKVAPLYRTTLDDPGILICPTSLETGTLYVLTSESSVRREVAFTDAASGKELRVTLDPGRAGALMVDRSGRVVARYEPVAVGR
jgi:Cellulase (glycosyl hydrolase family 5)